MPYSSYSSLSNQLHKELGTQTWFNGLSGYLLLRYGPIERRMLEASRYVEIHPDNKKAFSYEFSSIVRDIGSVFGSLMQHLLEKTASGNKEYTIDDFTKFLIDKVKDIELIGLSLQIPFQHNFVLPFEGIKSRMPPKTKLLWWEPYNNLKHSDIKNYKDGSLANAIYGISTLAVLHILMDPYTRLVGESDLFYKCGYYAPIDEAKKDLF